MKKRLTILLSSLLVAAALCVGIFAVPVKANADETVTDVNAAADEMLYFGDVVNSTAEVTLSSGEKEERPIIWDNLNANDVNTNFSMAEAVGTVEGTDTRVSRRFFTLPRGLVYFVNCGSQTGQADPGLNDVYYGLNTAILENYEAPTSSGKLLNAVPDQQFNASSGWGYAAYSASYPVSSKQMPTKAGDPMPPAFPYNAIRSTDSSDNAYGIKYTLGNLDSSKSYRIYLGTRSHWHMRRSTPFINGQEHAQIEISAVAKITVYDNVSPATNDGTNNSIQVWLKGASLDEGNCAFIAIQTMDAANEMATAAPEAPTYDDTLAMGQTTFDVGNATAGTKVQVSLSEAPFSILYEGMAVEDGDFTVTIPEGRLDGVFSLRLMAVNTFGASEYTLVFITDITDVSVEAVSDEYTSEDLAIIVKGKSDSNIVKIVVTHDYIDTEYDEEDDPNFGGTSYEGTIMVSENGLYTFTLYSGKNGKISQDITITQIDKSDVSLSIEMAVTGFTGNKPRLALTYEGAAPIASYVVSNEKGEVKASGDGTPADLELDYGRYAFAVTSESGKVATASAIVSKSPIYYTVDKDGERYTFKSANGKTISAIGAFTVNSSGTASRLVAMNSRVTNTEGNALYARVVFTDGTVEFTQIAEAKSAASASAGTTKKKGCGSAAGAASLPIALGALALCAVVVGAKRKSKAN